MRLLLSLLVLSILFSCKDEQKEQYLSDIQSMEQELDSLSALANDTTKRVPFNVTMDVRNTILKVKNNYLPDTIDYGVANMMNSYKEIRKAVESNSGNLAKVKQVLPEIEQKVEDLKHDIENGVGEREKYQEYLDYEKKKIEETKEVLDYYLKTNEKFYNRYDSLHPIVSNFADSLVNANKK